MDNVVIVEFPLKGTWLSLKYPGGKNATSGPDQNGEAYAYYLMKVKEKKQSNKFYNSSIIRYIIKGVPINKCYGWGANIYSPCDGHVIRIENGVEDRGKANIFLDSKQMGKLIRNYAKGKSEYKEIAGNYIILQHQEGIYALFSHLKKGSILTCEGQQIKKGQKIGEVGFSGASITPYLHFQLMDNENIKIAQGIPCAFRDYEIYHKHGWLEIENGIPKGVRMRK